VTELAAIEPAPRVPAARTAEVAGPARRREVPEASVARLPVYLRALHVLAESGATTVSSEALAVASGVNSAKVRKDLSHLGSYGTRGVGYSVEELVFHISRELGLTQGWAVVLVGVGNLGHALAGYGGFSSRGFRMAALLDTDPARIGEVVAGQRVRPLDDLDAVVAETGVSIGVIATPAPAAQEVCDRLVGAGVTSVLNFAPVVLQVPPGVDLRKVDLALELQVLSFHEHRKAAAGQAVRP
jgi:redox-sensing transcriptional repressor